MFSNLNDKKILYLNDRHEEKDTQNEDRRKLYDKRILSLLTENDLAIFGQKANSFLWDYYKSLGMAGIRKDNIFYVKNFLEYSSLTKAVLDNSSLIRQIKEKKPDVILPYIESHNSQILAQKINCLTLRDAEGVEQINNKSEYRQIIKELGFSLVPAFRVNNLKEAGGKFDVLKESGFKKIMIKKERSVAGFGIFIIKTKQELNKQVGENFSQESSFLLEGFIEDVKGSPNIQYWISPTEIKLIVLSDQLFEEDRISHQGNIFPSWVDKNSIILEKIKKLSFKICDYLQKKKMYGMVGIDYLITKDDKIYSTEINARLNASTFAALVVNELFGLNDKFFWKTFSLKGYLLPFEVLFNYSRKIFIKQKGDFGIFPIDIGILDSLGEGQFIAIGSNLGQVNSYIKEIRRIYENLFEGKM